MKTVIRVRVWRYRCCWSFLSLDVYSPAASVRVRPVIERRVDATGETHGWFGYQCELVWPLDVCVGAKPLWLARIDMTRRSARQWKRVRVRPSSSGAWSQQAKLTAGSDVSYQGHFGQIVINLGDIIVIGEHKTITGVTATTCTTAITKIKAARTCFDDQERMEQSRKNQRKASAYDQWSSVAPWRYLANASSWASGEGAGLAR